MLAAGVYLWWPVSVIRILADDQVLSTVPVRAGEEMTLEYRHSVTRTPVREVFLLQDGGGFVLVRTEQSDFGAGLPTDQSGSFRQEDGVYIISGIDRVLPVIPLRISEGSSQTLSIGRDIQTVFLDLVAPGTAVTVVTQRLRRAGVILR